MRHYFNYSMVSMVFEAIIGLIEDQASLIATLLLEKSCSMDMLPPRVHLTTRQGTGK
jgi:hypothetical protein